MLPKRTLHQLIEVARARSDNAARALGATNQREREETNRLDLLVNYREECVARLGHAEREGMDREAWLNYHRFTAKLEAAIAQQRELIAREHRKVEQCREEWRAATGRLKSFDTLDKRRLQSETTAERRREQREQDEAAARKSRPGG